MIWNHRVIEYKEGEETCQAIHEVYYRKDGSIWLWTESPKGFIKYEGENWETLFDRFRRATELPVLVEKMVAGGLVLVEK